jgi:prolipoprotein diacylglyceryltransferase
MKLITLLRFFTVLMVLISIILGMMLGEVFITDPKTQKILGFTLILLALTGQYIAGRIGHQQKFGDKGKRWYKHA